jgi:hypothetical protein
MLASMFLGVHFLAGMTNLTLLQILLQVEKGEKKTQLQTEELAA